ncbi:MAG: type VI secretion system baseplate subunit TssE [Saccharospirillaceae bacterium]|nr:type VI secretion system baseplate subunit TssE [Pseudomonadales bacterium]NRB81684.1 type VI secretion system baseplate subunit TssE [Saccharospirillaceae bacterium]
MSKERLLKRIRKWSVQDGRSYTHLDFSTYMSSLFADLSQVYNTRKGTVLLDDQFGIEDFTSLMSSMSPPEIEKLSQSFMSLTQRYETRLKNVFIKYEFREQDMGIIRFGATAKVEYQESVTNIKFHIMLLGNGSVAIELSE